MINDPNNTNMAPRQRTPTPEPASPNTEKVDKDKDPKEKESEDKEANGDKGEDEAASADKETSAEKKDGGEKTEEEEPIIYKMPTHLPLPVDDDGNHKSVRIPDSASPSKEVDEDFFEKAKKNYPNAPGREALLNDHMMKWFKVRRRWKEAAAKNEERYKPSMDLLKEMFEK